MNNNKLRELESIEATKFCSYNFLIKCTLDNDDLLAATAKLFVLNKKFLFSIVAAFTVLITCNVFLGYNSVFKVLYLVCGAIPFFKAMIELPSKMENRLGFLPLAIGFLVISISIVFVNDYNSSGKLSALLSAYATSLLLPYLATDISVYVINLFRQNKINTDILALDAIKEALTGQINDLPNDDCKKVWQMQIDQINIITDHLKGKNNFLEAARPDDIKKYVSNDEFSKALDVLWDVRRNADEDTEQKHTEQQELSEYERQYYAAHRKSIDRESEIDHIFKYIFIPVLTTVSCALGFLLLNNEDLKGLPIHSFNLLTNALLFLAMLLITFSGGLYSKKVNRIIGLLSISPVAIAILFNLLKLNITSGMILLALPVLGIIMTVIHFFKAKRRTRFDLYETGQNIIEEITEKLKKNDLDNKTKNELLDERNSILSLQKISR